MTEDIRLTSLAHGGGCGCKLAPAVLQELLALFGQPLLAATLIPGTLQHDPVAAGDVTANRRHRPRGIEGEAGGGCGALRSSRTEDAVIPEVIRSRLGA